MFLFFFFNKPKVLWLHSIYTFLLRMFQFHNSFVQVIFLSFSFFFLYSISFAVLIVFHYPFVYYTRLIYIYIYTCFLLLLLLSKLQIYIKYDWKIKEKLLWGVGTVLCIGGNIGWEDSKAARWGPRNFCDPTHKNSHCCPSKSCHLWY